MICDKVKNHKSINVPIIDLWNYGERHMACVCDVILHISYSHFMNWIEFIFDRLGCESDEMKLLDGKMSFGFIFLLNAFLRKKHTTLHYNKSISKSTHLI